MDDLSFDATLGRQEKQEIRRRKNQYQTELEEQGYEVYEAVGSDEQFMAVVVVDPQEDRRGLLGPNGTVQWLDEIQQAGVGALSQFIVSGVQREIDQEFGPSGG